jgi:hypothetical protein
VCSSDLQQHRDHVQKGRQLIPQIAAESRCFIDRPSMNYHGQGRTAQKHQHCGHIHTKVSDTKNLHKTEHDPRANYPDHQRSNHPHDVLLGTAPEQTEILIAGKNWHVSNDRLHHLLMHGSIGPIQRMAVTAII